MMSRYLITLLCLICLLQTTVQAEGKKSIIGWIEPVRVMPANIPVVAKIDTGADHSSINARDPETFRRNGQDWIRFGLTDVNGKNHTIELPVLRYTRIKRRGVEPQKRVVVELGICLDKQLRYIDVNLANRTDYNYKMLIGRSFLKGLFVVDADIMNVTSPDCRPRIQGNNKKS